MDIVARINSDIVRVGWSVMAVLGDETAPSFAYSIGLRQSYGHPELAIVGFDPTMMHELINTAGLGIRDGAKYQDHDQSDRILENYAVVFRTVPDETARNWARFAFGYGHDAETQLLQMFLPDVAGRFPWSENCEPTYRDVQSKMIPGVQVSHS